MIAAELHGKLLAGWLDQEDLLTAQVFGALNYGDRRLLHRYLAMLGVEVCLDDAQRAEFEFWPAYPDGTEPDVVVRVGRWYLLFEAKLLSGFGRDPGRPERDQLRRELREGRRAAQAEGLDFRLITVTRESWCDPGRYLELETERATWVFSNWQTVAATLMAVTAEELGRVGADLLELLVRRGLRPFLGFRRLGAKRVEPTAQIFFDLRASVHTDMFRGFARLAEAPRLSWPVGPVFRASARRWALPSSLPSLHPVRPVFWRANAQGAD